MLRFVERCLLFYPEMEGVGVSDIVLAESTAIATELEGGSLGSTLAWMLSFSTSNHSKQTTAEFANDCRLTFLSDLGRVGVVVHG